PVAAGDVDAHRDRLVRLGGDDDALAHARSAGTMLRRLERRRGLARTAGALLALLGAVRATARGELGAALLALGHALLGRALRTRLTGVLRPRTLARLLGMK